MASGNTSLHSWGTQSFCNHLNPASISYHVTLCHQIWFPVTEWNIARLCCKLDGLKLLKLTPGSANLDSNIISTYLSNLEISAPRPMLSVLTCIDWRHIMTHDDLTLMRPGGIEWSGVIRRNLKFRCGILMASLSETYTIPFIILHVTNQWFESFYI